MSDHVPPPFQIPATVLKDLHNLGALLDVGREAHQILLEMIQEVHHNLAGSGFDSDYKLLAYMLFSKGFMTFQAVRNLCLAGCGTDALALCGSLFENLVDLLYIRQAPVRRSRRYIEFEQVDKYYQAKKVLAYRRLPKGTRKRYQGYLESLTPQVTKLLSNFTRQRDNWSRKSLRDRAKAVKLGLEYDEFYYIFCGLKHTLPMGAAGYTFHHEDRVDVIYGPNIKGVYFAALHSTDYICRLGFVFQDAYSLSKKAQLRSLADRLGAAASAVQTTHPELCT